MTIVYVRSYSKEKRNVATVDEQEQVVCDYARSKGYRIVQVFKDEQQSGSSFNRPAFQEMIKYCTSNKGKLKYLMVTSSSRLANHQRELQRLRFFLRKLGVRMISIETSLVESVPKTPEMAYAQ